MKVQVKSSVTPDDIKRMVEDCFGAGCRAGAIDELQGGMFNSAYAIHLPDRGIETVLRVAPPATTRVFSYEHNLMRREVAVYERLRQDTTIPLPEIYGYNFRQDIVPADYLFISKLQGITLKDAQPSVSDEVYQSLAYELGGYAAQIHRIAGDGFGYFGSTLQTTWKTAFLQMTSNLLADYAAFGIGLPRPADEIQTLFEQCAPVLDDIREPRLLHGDLWDANVFVVEREQGWGVEAIIDCDRALWGDPDAEYSLRFRDHQPRFFEGYGRTFSNALEARCRRELYLTYFFLVVTLETSVRQQETDRSGWVDERLKKALEVLEQCGG